MQTRTAPPGTELRSIGDLTCLEHSADSATLVVLLHGLGMDAHDYLPFITAQATQHTIALTLQGFDPSPDAPAGPHRDAQPVEMRAHITAVSEALGVIADEHPHKRIVLVGFSLGADLVLQLAEHWSSSGEHPAEIASILLLDPNVNQSTMTISHLIADADPQRAFPAFQKLIGMADDERLFLALLDYVSKIAYKDFEQLRQLSRDTLAYWEPSGYRQIRDRLTTVAGVAAQVRVVLSKPYEAHLPQLSSGFASESSGRVSFKLTEHQHFDLISSHVLAAELSLLTSAMSHRAETRT